jgi:hypothetical protein
MVGTLHSKPLRHRSNEADGASDPVSRRYSDYGFVQSAKLDPSLRHLVTPGQYAAEVEDPEDPYDVDLDDLAEDHAESNHIGTKSVGTNSIRPLLQPTAASPLLDERNDRAFRHFVDVLAPCLSVFERPALDPWALPMRTLWSYTLPAAAMSNVSLAHAMLAVSGIHMAKMHQTNEGQSLKHFTYAARRIGRLLSQPQRRHDVTTLATVLLLGFYEVLCADHARWTLHLSGATKLLTEHDLGGLTDLARRTRRFAKERMFNGPDSYSQQTHQSPLIPSALLSDNDWDPDENLISHLTGLRVDYDMSAPLDPRMVKQSLMSEEQCSTYKMKMDLWWWFCKQDMFQSMISGEPLLMSYKQRLCCPPRGRLGIAENAHATFDHLVLIMSRLSDFGGKDRHRKQRSVEVQGGHWRPPLWLLGAGGHNSLASTQPSVPAKVDPETATNGKEAASRDQRLPSANEGRVRQVRTSMPSHPESAMFGMMPPPAAPPKMHSSFHKMTQSIGAGNQQSEQPPLPTSWSNMNLKDETEAALREHASIVKALDTFYQALGADFQPLPSDGTPSSSPFGSKLRFASPEIACIMAHYYVARVLLHRLHPEMPPAAMVAAGVTAHLTKGHAQMVGQIAAGLFASIPGTPGEPLSPRFAGALMEMTFPLLFCGVQYAEMSQRGWTISKLHNISQMTGWSTSAAVAAACETAWEKMGQAGKGPPYTRSLDRNNKDIRVSGSLRRIGVQLVTTVPEQADHAEQITSHNRSLISKHGSSRVHWAMGLLSVEEDVKKMHIGTV